MTQEVDVIAKGIGDVGMMAVTAAFFLVLTALLWVACFKWFKSIIDNMIKGNNKMVADLLVETRKQNEMLNDISEGLRPETLLRVKNTSNVHFDLAIYKVCQLINKVRTENHIVDKEATVKKIHTLLQNLHEDRNSRFDSYNFRGKRLSCYSNPEWIEWVAEVMQNEIYADSVSESRAYTNVTAVYERIKLDFYHKINQGL